MEAGWRDRSGTQGCLEVATWCAALRYSLQQLQGRVPTADIIKVLTIVIQRLSEDEINEEQPFEGFSSRLYIMRWFKSLNRKLPEISWLYQDIESSVSDVNLNIDSADREFLFSPFEAQNWISL